MKPLFAPAEPSTALVALQLKLSMVASTLIVTVLVSSAAQRFAAYVNAFRRCAPSVVPALPPTGAAAVASLKPSPAPSLLMTVIVAAPTTGTPAVSKSASDQ